MKQYESLYKMGRDQQIDAVFAHFYPVDGDYDAAFKRLALQTWEGSQAWSFKQPRFIQKYTRSAVPKLLNYLNYTFVRLVELEQLEPGRYFRELADGERICFNTGLQNTHQSDLIATFQKSKSLTRKGVHDFRFVRYVL